MSMKPTLMELASIPPSVADYIVRLEKVQKAAGVLAPKLRAVFDSQEFISLFTFAHVHGITYNGPRCETEILVALEDALRALDAPPGSRGRRRRSGR